MSKFCTIVGYILLYAALASIVVGGVATWWFEGWESLQKMYNPFAGGTEFYVNLAAFLMTVPPGWGLIKLGKYLKRQQSL